MNGQCHNPHTKCGHGEGMHGMRGDCLHPDCRCAAFFPEEPNSARCPRCGSPDPAKHPATSFEGEVQPCKDPWHQGINPEPGSNTRLQKWVDPAMFVSEPLKAEGGPKVFLLGMNTDPLGSIAACCKMYKGEVVRDLSEVTDDERREYLAEMQKTKLTMPLESVQLHFLIEGVTRSFTHQLVRQRTAAYAQESLRFAVVEDGLTERVALPPSLAGTKGGELKRVQDEWHEAWTNEEGRQEYYLEEDDPQIKDLRDRQGRLPASERWRDYWDKAIKVVGREYKTLVDAGMPAEDARGLLPHNITTRVHYITNLRGLLDHAGNRLCTQAQFEWRLVFARIAEAIRTYDPRRANAQRLYGEDASGWSPDMLPDRWQFEALAGLLKPVCYQTGKCEFKANFDRACRIRDRVDTYAAHNIPPNQWPHGVDDPRVPVTIQPIHPQEWLADPGAAR